MNSKEDISIYSLVSFDRGAKARWLLEEMKVPHRTVYLNREEKENESPAFLVLNPQGRVPVLKMGETVIYESGAICSYLADCFLERSMAPALSSPERAEYLQWMYFSSSTLDVIQTRIMIVEDIPAGEVRTQKEATLMSDLEDAMIALDRPLSRNEFLVGNRFSTADICVGYHLYFLTLWPELDAVIRKYPFVVQYLERLKSRPAAMDTQAMTYEG